MHLRILIPLLILGSVFNHECKADFIDSCTVKIHLWERLKTKISGSFLIISGNQLQKKVFR
jgi:hypothetical protein